MAATDYRIFLCDRMGVPVSNLSRVAMNRQFQYRMMRPARCSFEVPSDDAAVRSGTTPILKPGESTIKAWRREATGGWTLRYAGYVWAVDDEGGPDTYKTRVVCFDPFQRLARRLCRDSANAYQRIITFSATEPADIVEALIARTNAGGGESGVKDVALTSALGNISATFELRSVAGAILQICESYDLEFKVTPVHQTDGYLGQLAVGSPLGTDKSGSVVLGWQAPPNNVSSIERHLDMEPFANDLRLYGAAGAASPHVASGSDATSITAFGRYEDAEVHADISIQALLDQLRATELAFRKAPRELVSWRPQGDQGTLAWWSREMLPWDDFDLGDLVSVNAGPKLRGGFSGIQRVYGWTIDLDDDAVERVSEIVTSIDA